MQKKDPLWLSQLIPLLLTLVICALLVFGLLAYIRLLNKVTATDILTDIRFRDVAVGMTIYLKTSVDFAIFIGNLMGSYRGWKNRVMIEMGTALGNAVGTFIVLGIWDFFRDVEILLAGMILIAALVLLKLAEEGLEHTHYSKGLALPHWFESISQSLEKLLHNINRVAGKPLEFIMPNLSMRPPTSSSLKSVFIMSFSIPFILGLDDFAGYVPVFNIVNVYGFATGVIAGHMALNILLFVHPRATIRIVKHPVISFLGSIAFIGLALWGFWEVIKLMLVH